MVCVRDVLVLALVQVSGHGKFQAFIHTAFSEAKLRLFVSPIEVKCEFSQPQIKVYFRAVTEETMLLTLLY